MNERGRRSRSPYGQRRLRRSRSRSRSMSRSPRGHSVKDDRRTHHRPRSRSLSQEFRRSDSTSRSRLQRRRSRSRSRSRTRRDEVRERDREKRRRHRSRSRSSSSSGSSSDGRRRRRKKKERRKDRKDKKDKKDKKKRPQGTAALTSQWGKYGIISDADIYAKEPEFRTWLVEEKMVNPETLSKDQTKKLFAQFVEDFNTATLSHEKYYDMEQYERRMVLLRSGDLNTLPDDGYDANADLLAHSSSFKRRGKGEPDQVLTTEQLQELRKVQNERIQMGKMKLLGMNVKQNMGVRMDTQYE